MKWGARKTSAKAAVAVDVRSSFALAILLIPTPDAVRASLYEPFWADGEPIAKASGDAGRTVGVVEFLRV